jgi:hypothetical protein
MLARMGGQKPGRPQFVRIAELFGLRHANATNQAFASAVMLGSLPGRGRSSSEAITPHSSACSMQRCNSLMMEPQGLPDRIKGRFLPLSQQHSRPLYPARRLGARPRYRPQLRQFLPAKTQFNLAPSSCHELRLNHRIKAQTTALPRPDESHLHANRFMESLV